jgi:hypothetical protein
LKIIGSSYHLLEGLQYKTPFPPIDCIYASQIIRGRASVSRCSSDGYDYLFDQIVSYDGQAAS